MLYMSSKHMRRTMAALCNFPIMRIMEKSTHFKNLSTWSVKAQLLE